MCVCLVARDKQASAFTHKLSLLVRYGYEDACWLAVDNYEIWAFLGPMCAVILVNTILFVLILRSILSVGVLNSDSVTKQKFLRGCVFLGEVELLLCDTFHSLLHSLTHSLLHSLTRMLCVIQNSCKCFVHDCDGYWLGLWGTSFHGIGCVAVPLHHLQCVPGLLTATASRKLGAGVECEGGFVGRGG